MNFHKLNTFVLTAPRSTYRTLSGPPETPYTPFQSLLSTHDNHSSDFSHHGLVLPVSEPDVSRIPECVACMPETLHSCCLQLTVFVFDAHNTCASSICPDPSVQTPPGPHSPFLSNRPEFSGAHHQKDSRGSFLREQTLRTCSPPRDGSDLRSSAKLPD